MLQEVPWLRRHPPQSPRRRRSYQRIKRIMDVSLVLAASPVWLPIAGVVAAAVKIDDPKGSILFKQFRTGTNNKRIAIYKFRSMVHNAEELKHTLMHLNERTWPDFKITNDPRITKVGKFIRATSLDEVPQLLNVLEGKLSLVGPRPITLKDDVMQGWHLERFHATSGLTGLWQIAGRDFPDYGDRVRMDVAYLDRQSLALDLEILARTALSVILKEGK